MNILTQKEVRSSHKLLGLSFPDILDLNNGEAELVHDIENGLVCDSRAMEVAMHSISYAVFKYKEAQDITDAFVNNKENYKASIDGACKEMATAKGLLRMIEKSFKHYPLIVCTAEKMLKMFSYYEAYMIIPVISGIQIEEARKGITSTYFFKNKVTGLIKIGKSVDVKTRKQAVQCGSGSELEVLFVINSDVEAEMHKMFSEYRRHGEWFDDVDGKIKSHISKIKKKLASEGVA